MAGIGDYIHYYPSRYAAMGIQRTGKESGKAGVVNSIQIYNKQRERMLIKFAFMKKQENLEEMEDRLNIFFRNQDNSEAIDDHTAMDANIELLEEEFTEEIISGINKKTGEIIATETKEMKQLLEEAERQQISVVRAAIEESNTYLNTLYKRFDLLELALEEFALDKKTYKRIKKLIDIEYKMINDIITARDSKYNEISRLKNKEIKSSYLLKWKDIQNNTVIINKKEYNVVTLMNYLIKESGIFPVLRASAIKGQFLENSIIAALAVGDKKSKEEIKKAITQGVQNFNKDNKKKATIDFGTYFSSDIPFSQISSQVDGYSASNKMLVSNIASDGKLDVSIDWGGSPRKISAKNYNLSINKGVTLVNGTNLLYILQDEDSEFVNHYFNILATSKTTSFDINYYRREAYTAAAITILYKALTGDTFGRADEIAEIFVVKDSSKADNSVKVYDMGDILRTIGENIDKLDEYIYMEYGRGKNIKDLVINNDWVGEKQKDKKLANDRIANFLVNAMKVKLHVALKENTLSQFQNRGS